jgi:hypothetical protein
VDSPRRPDWWLDVDASKAADFVPRAEDEGAVSIAGSRLSLRFRWDAKLVDAYWDDEQSAPPLEISWNHETLFSTGVLSARQWVALGLEASAAMERVLQTTSIVTVAGDRSEPVPILVQEEGMAHRPSLLFDLSPAEILRYWSLLSNEQRAAFLEAHAPEVALAAGGADLLSKYSRVAEPDSFFDRFAGIFISFGQLERNVRDSLKGGNPRAAVYRLFGQKYDSLGTLLARVQKDSGKGADGVVEHYVMALCAKQMVKELRKDVPDFFKEHADEAKHLDEQLGIADALHDALATDPSMKEFLVWFEEWFLKRAKPVHEEASA